MRLRCTYYMSLKILTEQHLKTIDISPYSFTLQGICFCELPLLFLDAAHSYFYLLVKLLHHHLEGNALHWWSTSHGQSQGCTPRTDSSEKANMVGSVKSSMYKDYTCNKTLQQLWRYTGIKHLMCWEETKYFEIWIHDSFIQLNILLYHFKRYHWHQPHHSNGKSDFYAKGELI